MKIYNYDRDTGEYTCESIAEKNQVGAGYLIPAFATEIAPPDYGENQKPFFNNNQWIIQPHFKGKKQVELETKMVSIIDYLGAVKEGYQYVTDETAEELMRTPDMFTITNGALKKLSESEFAAVIRLKAIEKRKQQIEYELEELDKKRIRAICEPEIKDEKTSESWLDYYTEQIYELRTEYAELKNEGL